MIFCYYIYFLKNNYIYNLNNYYTGLFPFGDGSSNNLSYTVALSRNNTFTNPIFPLGGSEFVLSARFSLPYSLWNGVDYANLGDLEKFQDDDGNPDPAKIEQEKFKWLEFYKIKFKGSWYTRLFDKLVLRTHTEFGFLGAFNNDRGVIPFDRFFFYILVFTISFCVLILQFLYLITFRG